MIYFDKPNDLSLKNFCIERMKELSWYKLDFLHTITNFEESAAILKEEIPPTHRFWHNIASLAEARDIDVICALQFDKIVLRGPGGKEKTIGLAILLRALRDIYREVDFELIEKILPHLSSNEIEEALVENLHSFDGAKCKLAKLLVDRLPEKRVRGWILSKIYEKKLDVKIAQMYFSPLFKEEEWKSIDARFFQTFQLEILSHRLRHAHYDWDNKRLLLQENLRINAEDGQALLDVLASLPTSDRTRELASLVYAASQCEHPAILESHFFKEPVPSSGIKMKIEGVIYDRLKEKAKTGDRNFVERFFRNFCSLLGNAQGVLSIYHMITQLYPKPTS